MLLTACLRLQAAPTVLAEIPFEYREGLLWVEVNTPHSSTPLNFLLDTGAGMSVVNLSTAQRLGLKPGREIVVHGVGKDTRGYLEKRILAKAGSVDLPTEYLAIDLGKFSRSCQRPVDGLIGADFFRDRTVQIDFDAQKIRLLNPQKTDLADTLKLEVRPGGMRVPITVNGQSNQWVRLDTGCATSLHWVTASVPTRGCAERIAIGLAEVSVPQTKTTIIVGTSEFESVPTDLHNTPIFPGESGLLGNGILARYSRVTIDAKASCLIFGELRVSH